MARGRTHGTGEGAMPVTYVLDLAPCEGDASQAEPLLQQMREGHRTRVGGQSWL